MPDQLFVGDPLPLNASVNQKKEDKPQLTFWFQKEDETFFCTNEEEAWNLRRYGVRVSENGEMKRKLYKYLGASDGTRYFQAIQEVNKVMREKGLAEAQKLLREAYDNERNFVDPKIAPQNFDVYGDKNAREEFLGSKLR